MVSNPYRWTVRTEAMDAVVKQYSVLMETMEEIHQTTRDEYGLKAAGVVAALERFEIFFGLKLGHLLFGAAEETSKALQVKDSSVQEAVTAVSVTRAFYERQRSDSAFDKFFNSAVAQANDGEPKLPQYRKPPKRLGGSDPHVFTQPKEYFRQKYYSACDILIQELLDRFEQRQSVLAMESILIKFANGDCHADDLETLKVSVLKKIISLTHSKDI